MADGCDRLVEPSVKGAERERQRRFIGVMLAGPFILGSAWPAMFAAQPGALGLGLLAALFCTAWIAVVVVSSRGLLNGAALGALAITTPILAAATAAAGGFWSPCILIVGALIFEPWWTLRSKVAGLAGLAAAGTALALQPAMSLFFEPISPDFAAWHWLVPLAYAAVVAPRLAPLFSASRTEAGADEERPLEDVLDAVVLRLNRAGDAVDVAGQTDRLLGVPSQMLLGNGLFDRIHVADRVAYLTAIADIRDGAARRAIELRLRTAATDDCPGGTHAFSVVIHAGEPILVVLSDQSEVVALRAELTALRDHAASVELTKSRFLAAVSHELRTPLNAIIGFSDMLAHEMVGPFADPRQKEYAGLIRDSGAHLLSVVNSILDVSKIEAGTYPIRPEDFAVAEAASACHAMLSLQATEKSICFENHVAANAGEIHCDRRAVQQILINLLSNAIKFTPKGGAVRLDARRQGRSIVLEVTDSGIGISEDDLANLGRPFVQVQNDYTRQFDGAGLGLSIVKGLVALHEGSMAIDSAPGAGTIVTVTLPVGGPGGAPRRPGGQDTRRLRSEQGEHGHAAFRKSA
ncbi:MAG: PAS domain-containing sensor histidine kinase [Mesorhizobium sp.]|nr:PAS domain-containing sensor histidine kinase [Mesorhizobium sp.]